jgi:hypothetical protein
LLYIGRKVNNLYASRNPPVQSADSDIRTEDCKVLFSNSPVKAYNNECICADGSYLYNYTCGMMKQISHFLIYYYFLSIVFYLEYSIPGSETALNCPDNAEIISSVCKCKPGYEQLNNQTCRK